MKNRLVGALVISALAVIFLPPILEKPKHYYSSSTGYIQPPPLGEQSFTPHLLPPEDEEPLIPPKSLRQAEALAPITTVPQEIATSHQELAATSQPAQDLTAWVIKLGSFSSQKKADKLKQDLRKKAFPAFITISQTGSNIAVLLRVGPIIDKKTAESMAAEVAKQFNITGEVVQYP